MKRGRREGTHREWRDQGVERPARWHREHHLGFVLEGRARTQLTKAWGTLRKDAFKVKYWHTMWEGERRHDGMGNWDVSVIRVMNLNIGRRWGNLKGSAEESLSAPFRRRRQFHPNVFVPNVWVQCFVFIQGLLCGGSNLNWPSRVTGMFDQIECGIVIPPWPVCRQRRPIRGISSNHWIAEVHHVVPQSAHSP